MMLANFIRLIEDTLDDLREHDVVDLVPVGMRIPSTAPRHQLLYVTLGLVNKFSAAGSAGELQATFSTLWTRVEDLEQAARETGYRARGLEMVLRRLQPVLNGVPVPAHWTPAF